jgi:penicillin-binding protein 1A
MNDRNRVSILMEHNLKPAKIEHSKQAQSRTASSLAALWRAMCSDAADIYRVWSGSHLQDFRARATRRAGIGRAGGASGRTLKSVAKLVSPGLRAARMAFTAAGIAMLSLAGGMLFVLFELPFERRLLEVEQSTLVLTAADGSPSGRVGPWIENPVKLEQFPGQLVSAVLSVEDRRFYQHFGLDPFGIVRATHQNANAGNVVAGGSTITQQLVKTRIVGSERTLARKLREAMAAIWLELRLGKDEILTRYLNSIYMGAGAYGMPAASRIYFDKPIDSLTLAESAILAGIIKSPSLDNPIRNPAGARARASVVLDAMVATGGIDAETARQAKTEPVHAQPDRRQALSGAWFNDWIARHRFPEVVGRSARAMQVETTLEPGLQALAQRAVRRHLDTEGKRRNAQQAAMVVMRPNGAVVAMVGGRDYAESKFNRAADARRQPGSAFKIFVYLASLRDGYSLDSTIDASPISIGTWNPKNYGGASYGHVREPLNSRVV